jgi:hypothetical protein
LIHLRKISGMTQQTINLGTKPNSGTGDTLRNAFGKVNNNFAELYTYVTGGSTNSGVTAGDYGGANTSVQISVNEKGQITNATTFSLDLGTSFNVADSIVRRDANGDFAANNVTLNAVLANGTPGSLGQVLVSDGVNSRWANRFYVGTTPPDNPYYGDIWYFTGSDADGIPATLVMWINDGSSDYWYDFLPPQN